MSQFLTVAVGMPVTRHPPHRSGLALLTHPAPRSDQLRRGKPFVRRLARVTRVVPLCVGLVSDLTTFSSRQALPSPTSARDSVPFVRPVRRYYCLVRLLCNVHARRTAQRLLGPLSIASRGCRGLPVLAHVVSRRAQVPRLRRAGRPLAIERRRPCGLPFSQTRSAP